MFVEQTLLSEEANEADISHHVWRKNSPWLYDTLLYHILELPSLTCQFLPVDENNNQSTLRTQKVVIGTQTSPTEDINHLMIVKLKTPSNFCHSQYNQNFSISKPEQSVLKPGFSTVQIETKIVHPGDVNRAKCSPKAYNLIATKSSDGKVYLFDYSKHPALPKSNDAEPLLTLTGHELQGFGLDWAQNEYIVASGSNDGIVCLWDLEKSETRCTPTISFSSMGFAINELKFHPSQTSLLALGCEDGAVRFIDTRRANRGTILSLSGEHEIFSLDLCPQNDFLILSAAQDGKIRLWDLRYSSSPLLNFEQHTQSVVRVIWHPTLSGIFASCSSDKSIMITDSITNKAWFKHIGHFDLVSDFDWSQSTNLGIVSVSEDNCLQYWEPDILCF